MKFIITGILFLFLGVSSSGQNLKLSAEVVNDFATSFYYQYKYENSGGIKSLAFLTGRQLGYSLVDVEVAVETIAKDDKFREGLFKMFLDLYRGDEQFVTLNLISMGMRATNAKLLGKYIISKYRLRATDEGSTQINSTNNTLPPISIIRCGYQKLHDSLTKNHIEYVIDSAISDEIFIGYNLKTSNGKYFISKNYTICSYSFEITQALKSLVKYLLNQGAKVKQKEAGYIILAYKGILVQILELSDQKISVTYNKLK